MSFEDQLGSYRLKYKVILQTISPWNAELCLSVLSMTSILEISQKSF